MWVHLFFIDVREGNSSYSFGFSFLRTKKEHAMIRLISRIQDNLKEDIKMKLEGIHHVSAITANADKNHDFFTRILGMRLVKKSVNQDSTSSYHLFYADAVGTPGTDMTYFDIPMAGKTYPGVSSISSTAFRVQSEQALDYWINRFKEFGVPHGQVEMKFNRPSLE